MHKTFTQYKTSHGWAMGGKKNKSSLLHCYPTLLYDRDKYDQFAALKQNNSPADWLLAFYQNATLTVEKTTKKNHWARGESRGQGSVKGKRVYYNDDCCHNRMCRNEVCAVWILWKFKGLFTPTQTHNWHKFICTDTHESTRYPLSSTF